MVSKATLVLLLLAIGLGGQNQPPSVAGASALGVNGLIDGVNHLTNSLVNSPLELVKSVPNALNSVTKPLSGALGALSSPAAAISALGAKTSALVDGPSSLPMGLLNGFATGLGMDALTNTASSAANPIGKFAGNIGSGPTGSIDELISGLTGSVGQTASVNGLGNLPKSVGINSLDGVFSLGHSSAGQGGNTLQLVDAVDRAAASVGTAESLTRNYGNVRGALRREVLANGEAAADALPALGLEAAQTRLGVARAMASQTAAQDAIATAETTGAVAGAHLAAAEGLGAASAEGPTGLALVNGGRQALAAEALANAQAESAIAGSDMVAHGANNARSAALASNAYRQAKLASARDRINVAGTIQNSARISDAAIATHDAATKAEDSLLGSELAVDSAATVLDSDAAYIPPVTNSLLRSLPYGRLGLRNIVPKPLTYPSTLLPDVWLNGMPVNYLNVPFRMLPYGPSSTAATNSLLTSSKSLAGGLLPNGQPFWSNNGIPLNAMLYDPTVAYLAANMNGVVGSSILPILANGQLEAHDEVAMANVITNKQQLGPGMAATYNGFGRMNPVPMITGSVSDVNLAPTTTIGTTYPIGSALVIEPRDSFFQDYVDNASSRQNFDERQQ